jgi:LysM repeat protein
MNNDNPLIPQGSLMEQKSKNKPHLRIAFVIAAVHVVLLGGFLIAGCKRDEAPPPPAQTNETALPSLDSLYGSNAVTGLSSNDQYGTVAPILGTNMVPAPVLSPVVTPAPAPAAQEYVVARGDSFYSIGKKFGVSANAIAKANPGVDSTRLRIGQKLQIPASTSAPGSLSVDAPFAAPAAETYTVKSGDTLTKIAREHGTTVTALKELNGLKIDRINLGQKLKLPAKAAPADAPAPVVPMTYPSTNLGAPPPLTSTPISR